MTAPIHIRGDKPTDQVQMVGLRMERDCDLLPSGQREGRDSLRIGR